MNETQDLEKSVQEAKDFLEELKDRARQAHAHDDLFMLRLYEELLKVTSPLIVRAVARVEREQKAEISKQTKALAKVEWDRKKAEREARQQSNQEAK